MDKNDPLTLVNEVRAMALAGVDIPALLHRIQQILGRSDCRLESVICFHKAFGGGIADISPVAGWIGFGGTLNDAEVCSFVGPVISKYRANQIDIEPCEK